MATDPQTEMPPMRPVCGGPSLNTLRRLDAGELRGGEQQRVRMHTDACAECQAVLRDFEVTRAALRTALPFTAFEARLQQPRRGGFLGWWRWATAGAIGAAAAAFLLVPAVHHDQALTPSPTQTKGGLSLDFVVKSGAQVRPGRDGDALKAGDALEFRYDANGHPWVLIVGVDADGKVFPYVTNGDRSAPAGKGLTPSPNAVVLDEDRRAERVFALFSQDPIGVDEIKPAVRDGLAAAQGKIEALTTLPGFADQASILIRKAAP